MHVYLSHPQVQIDPNIPVPKWGLSQVGRQRAEFFSQQPWVRRFTRIVSSDETKAIETANCIAVVTGVSVEIVHGLHENDRSATGFLPPPEFEAVANQFFANPGISIRGWEKASDAQVRIVDGVTRIIAQSPGAPVLFVGHGGVGTLLKCALRGIAITRSEDQGPGGTGGTGGGNHFGFALSPPSVLYGWESLEHSPP